MVKWDKVNWFMLMFQIASMMQEPATIGKTLDQLTYRFAGLIISIGISIR